MNRIRCIDNKDMNNTMEEKYLSGIVCAVITPMFNKGKEIDELSLKRVVNFLINAGIHGLFIAGTNGECLLLNREERKYLTKIVSDEASGKIPVIIHTGALSLRETLSLTEDAVMMGANGVAVVIPPFFRLDSQSLFEYYDEIASSFKNTGIYIYNIPSYSGNDISIRVIRDLFERNENFVGIKYSHTDLIQLHKYINEIPHCDVLIGCDRLLIPALHLGAKGMVSGNVVLYPELFVDFYNNFKQGRIQNMMGLERKIFQLDDLLSSIPSISAYKFILKEKGIISDDAVRSPLRSLTEEEKMKIKIEMNKLKEEDRV